MMNQHFVLVLSAVQLILASGQADTELKSSCLLQTGAAREQPLAMNHGEDVVSRPEYLRNALVMVRELASNVTAWDTDLSQSERNSLDVIKQFITDLFQSAANSHDEDQREVNRARDLIGDCASTAKTSLTNDVQPLKNIMQGSRQDHNTCRTSEGGCQTHQNQACAEWEAYRKSNTPTECAGVAFKAHMGTQVESTKLDMEQCLRDLQPYYLKHIPCWQYKGCVDGFAPLCDNNQTKFERDFCGYSSQLSYTCQAQIDCRERHIKFRDDTHADVVVNEAARKADYTTGKKVLCYFKVFEAKNPNKSAILQGCDKLTVDTSKLDITYPGTPAPNPCVVEAEEPCTTGWVDAEYKNKKWTNHVTLNACEKCVAPTPAPTPPPTTPGIKTNDGYMFETCIQDCGTTSKGVVGNRVCDDKQKGVKDPKECPVWCKGMGYKKFMLACPTSATTECWCCNTFDKANGGVDHEILQTSECTGGTKTSGLNGNSNGGCSGTPTGTFEVDGYFLGGWCTGAAYLTGL